MNHEAAAPKATRSKLIAVVQSQAAGHAILKVRIAEFGRRFDLDPTNGSMPPSSDWLKRAMKPCSF